MKNSMKKQWISMMLIICILISVLGVGSAQETEKKTLQQMVDAIWIKQYSEVCEVIDKKMKQKVQEITQAMREDEAYKHKYGNQFESRIELEIDNYVKMSIPDFDNGYQFYYLDNTNYALQYAQNRTIEYLLDDVYWYVPSLIQNDTQKRGRYYNSTLENNNNFVKLIKSGVPVIPVLAKEFVLDTVNLEKMLKEAGAEEFVDFKVLVLNAVQTALYFKYSNEDYVILIRDADNYKDKPDLALFQVYTLCEVLERIGAFGKINVGGPDIQTKEVLNQKPTYEAEATVLQEQGLLNGNEKGLDLLKPLTRIEATAMLVRALDGEAGAGAYTASIFNDMQDTHWGTKYAVYAYENGITQGIGNGQFDPDSRITSNQFSTLLLRASGEADVDWTQATNEMVEKGIITAEQAVNMDFFTRGDMAKLIYEAKAKGLL